MGLRFCESSGVYTTNTGNGYYGAYQMDLAFWVTYGGDPSLVPSQASRDAQDEVAYKGWLARGFQPWPVCGK